MGEKLTTEEVEEVFRDASSDKNGMLNYDDFLSMMTGEDKRKKKDDQP